MGADSALPSNAIGESVELRTPQTVDVVAVVLGWRGRIGLFKRSRTAQPDRGRWHCLVGYLDDADDPDAARLRAEQKLREAVGLTGDELADLVPGPVLEPDDPAQPWRVHTFWASTTRRRLTISSEHDAYRWVRPAAIARFDGQAEWLSSVLRAVVSLQQVAPVDERGP